MAFATNEINANTTANQPTMLPESTLLFGHVDPSVPVLLQRWTPVPVASIESVEIVNPQFEFQNNTQKVYAREVIFSAPTLVAADLRVGFTIPFRMDTLANYSANVIQETTISSRECTVNIGTLSVSGQEFLNTEVPPETLPFQQISKISLVIPILENKAQKIPLLDRVIKPKGKPGVTHHTLKFHGISSQHMKPVVHYIRFKVNHAQGNRIEGLNISTSVIDMPRIAETWSLFVEWLKQATKKMESFVVSTSQRFKAIEAPRSPNVPVVQSTVVPVQVVAETPKKVDTPDMVISNNNSSPIHNEANTTTLPTVVPNSPQQYYYQVAPPAQFQQGAVYYYQQPQQRQ